jgi:hypothetical protein
MIFKSRTDETTSIMFFATKLAIELPPLYISELTQYIPQKLGRKLFNAGNWDPKTHIQPYMSKENRLAFLRVFDQQKKTQAMNDQPAALDRTSRKYPMGLALAVMAAAIVSIIEKRTSFPRQ